MITEDIEKMTDKHLATTLRNFGVNVGPITGIKVRNFYVIPISYQLIQSILFFQKINMFLVS